MKARISALMDSELEQSEAAGPLESLKVEDEARETWRTYHLISDAMRDTQLLSAGFSARVCAKLAGEPTVVAPSRLRLQPSRALWQALPAAASIAAVALVGWLWFMPQEGATIAPRPEVAQGQAAPPAAALVQPPDAANDYLLAHQGYSPRNSLQGMAPYVRMVSGEAGTGKR